MYYKDKSGHFTTKENNGGECPHNTYQNMSVDELKRISQKANPERVLKNELVIKLPDFDEEEFAYEVDAVVNGTFDKRNSHIKVLDETPQIYIEKAGMKNLPILISYKKLCVSMFEKSEFSDHAHGLGVDIIKQIPKALKDPMCIYEGQKNDRVEAVLALQDKKGREILSVIEFNSYGLADKKHIESNILVTAFGAKQGYINNRVNNSKILYKKN